MGENPKSVGRPLFLLQEDTAVDLQRKCRQRANEWRGANLQRKVGSKRKWGQIAKTALETQMSGVKTQTTLSDALTACKKTAEAVFLRANI